MNGNRVKRKHAISNGIYQLCYYHRNITRRLPYHLAFVDNVDSASRDHKELGYVMYGSIHRKRKARMVMVPFQGISYSPTMSPGFIMQVHARYEDTGHWLLDQMGRVTISRLICEP